MFRQARAFNGDVSNFDTRQVTSMELMFADADEFDGILDWDTRNVENVKEMFARCTKFKGQGIEKWNTSRVRTMSGMLRLNGVIDIDLSGWDTSSVEDMSYLFLNCFSFRGKGLEVWNVSNTINFSNFANNAPRFNPNLRYWDVSNAESMGSSE